uniref:Uncharacterized protein n=1 Tax=Meloidogyne enterolobii TaxID=390850 RepID=A0A6V7W6A7_MELEN|nr:unnamed protein product [Meloidogyne enterolobii]
MVRPVRQDIMKIVLQRELTQMNGCGNCTSATCKTCTGHRCNDGKNFPYYCLNSDGTSLLECPSPNCYIDKKLNAGCGTCDGNKIDISCVDCSDFKCNSRNKLNETVFCYEREENGQEKEGSRPCTEKRCFISADTTKGESEGDLKKYTRQGCGKCPSPAIPCQTCNSSLCNNETLFKDSHYCWAETNTTIPCKISEYGNVCYYAVINDSKVEQGCGDKTSWTEYNVLAAKCQNKHLCNTKKLFNESLFCLNKAKDMLVVSKKSLKQCNEECYFRRLSDGRTEQGCGKCTEVDCRNCKQNFCNHRTIGVKHCWTNNGTTCSTGYYDNCFTERTSTNELNKGCGNCTSPTCKTCTQHRCNDGNKFPYYCFGSDGKILLECPNPDCYIDKDFNAGCGTCDENKVNVSCVDCRDYKCNSINKTEQTIFCYERKESGEEEKGRRQCDKKMCYINVDLLKGRSEEMAFKEFTKQGCGNCPDNSITCRTCNSKHCNSQQFFKERHFCWISENSTEQCSVSEHKRICYYAVINDNIVEQGCGNKTWNESNVRAAKCQNKHLCNTKKLFDESLFCLNKGKDDLNETKSSVIQCDNECFTRRYLDGKLEQGCGNCTDVDCKSCKINFCNTKEIGVKHCWTNNGSTCSTGYYQNCFTERIETNECIIANYFMKFLFLSK